jgi:cell division protein FtsQ
MRWTVVFAISFLLITTLCGIYIFVSHSPRFNLARIYVQGNRKVSEKEIKEKVQIELGTNIFRMKLGMIENLVREDKRIKEVWVKRILPNQILIEVEEKKPALWINLPEGLFGLSQNQEIIPLEEEDFDQDLPVVTGLTFSSNFGKENPKAKPYEWWPNKKAKLALDFYKILSEQDSSFMTLISEISLSDESNLVFYLIPYGTQVNMGKGNLKKKLKRVKAFLDYEGEAEDLAGLDLRFKDQVVVKKSLPGLIPADSCDSQSRLPEMKQKGVGEEGNL